MTDDGLVLCYNRGCGQRFNPKNNGENSCLHHPEPPFFHDAYKGWNCCKKKCTDFTEFLNIKGCTRSSHNPIKPPEPEKPEVDKSSAAEVIEYKMPEPIKPSLLERPSFEMPLVKLKGTITPSLQQEIAKLQVQVTRENGDEPTVDGIVVGTQCKNGGCKATYLNEDSNDTVCIHHPGVPIFHEGLKFWTCCQRRTTDFQAFLNQEGCTSGTHLWKKEDQGLNKIVQCRHDWMQTGTHVIVSIYCKKYDPRNENLTCVEVNPIRLRVRIYFPENDSYYTTDIELRGIIDPLHSSVTYSATKVEIKLKKAEPMSWNRLDIPHATTKTAAKEDDKNLPKVDTLDLSDL